MAATHSMRRILSFSPRIHNAARLEGIDVAGALGYASDAASLIGVVALNPKFSLDVKLKTFKIIHQVIHLGHVFFRLRQ